jgi:hypothetical protein
MSDEQHHSAPAASEEDERLLLELRAIVNHGDPVPRAVIDAAIASFTWRTIEAELARIVFDSAVDQEVLAVVRGGAEPRLLTFEAPGLSVEVEVAPVGPRRRLVGQLIPPQPARIEVRHADGTLTVTADRLGRFHAAEVSAGLVSLRCHLSAPTATVVRPGEPDPALADAGAGAVAAVPATVVTDWITL